VRFDYGSSDAGYVDFVALNGIAQWHSAGTVDVATLWFDVLSTNTLSTEVEIWTDLLFSGTRWDARRIAPDDWEGQSDVQQSVCPSVSVELPAGSNIVSGSPMVGALVVDQSAPGMLLGALEFDPSLLTIDSVIPAGQWSGAQVLVETNALPGSRRFLFSRVSLGPSAPEPLTNDLIAEIAWTVTGPVLSTGSVAVSCLATADGTGAEVAHSAQSTHTVAYFLVHGAPGDIDGDSLPDWWEQTFFGGPTNAIAGHDWDGDGALNDEEFAAGTNPIDENDVFCFSQPHMPGNGTVELCWPSVAHRVYRIRSSRALTSGAESWQMVVDNISATPPENRQAVLIGTNTVLFYRVELDY